MSRYVNLFPHSSGRCAFFCDGGWLGSNLFLLYMWQIYSFYPMNRYCNRKRYPWNGLHFFLWVLLHLGFSKRFRAVWVERWEMLECEKDIVFYYFFLFLCSLSKGSNQFISNIPEGRSWEEKPRSRRNAEQAGSFCVSVADQGNLHNMQTRYEKGLGPWLVGFYNWDNTTQLFRDYNKPLSGSLLKNQESKRVFFVAQMEITPPSQCENWAKNLPRLTCTTSERYHPKVLLIVCR